jgi:PRTRC genetic system protein E
MFRELAPLFAPNVKTGIVTLTVAKVDETHLRVTVQPFPQDGKDAPNLVPVQFIGTPEELDTTPIDFSPATEEGQAAPTAGINEQIKESAKDNAGDKAAKSKSTTKQTTVYPKKPSTPTPAKPAAPKAPVKSAAEIAAEKAKVKEAELAKKKADEAAAAEKKRVAAEQKARDAAEKAKKDKAEEIARLQKELQQLENSPELPIAGGS